MNTKRNKTKTLLFVGLLLAVAGLTLGFAAFSNTLTIKSSATVTPDASTFSVQFSASETEILVGEENPILPNQGEGEGAIIDINNPTTVGNLKITLDKDSSVLGNRYELYIHNTGEYDAYLNEIKLNNVDGTELLRKCTAIETGDETRATDALVEAACDSVTLRVIVSGAEKSENVTETSKVSGHKLEKGAVETFRIIFNNKATDPDYNQPIADGPYMMEFGDIELVYSTVDVNAETVE